MDKEGRGREREGEDCRRQEVVMDQEEGMMKGEEGRE